MFKLKVQCFSGLVLLQPDSYVCYDGFNDKATELICGELGFLAAEEYSIQSLPRTATRNKTQRLTCSQVSVAVCDHPSHVANGDWSSNIARFGSMITLTCREGYIIDGGAILQQQTDQSTIDYISDIKLYVSFKHPADSNEGNLQMYPTDTSSRKSGTEDHAILLHTTSTDARLVYQPLSEHQGNQIGDAHHIYQNSAKVESTAAKAKKEIYMDMSGTVKEKMKEKIPSVQSMSISPTERDTGEDGYLLSNVRVTGNKPYTGSTAKACDIDNVPFCGDITSLMVLEPDRFVCYDGFNDKAAKLICGELGFPAAEGYSNQTLPSTTARKKTQRLTCSQDAGQNILELTTSTRSSPTSPSVTELLHQTKIIMYSLGTSLCVVLALLAILAITRCMNHLKARRPSETVNSMDDRSNDGQMHMYPIGTSGQNLSMADNVDSLNGSSTAAGAVGHSFRYNPDNRFGDATFHQEDQYRIYQNAAEVTKMGSQTADEKQISSSSLLMLSGVQSAVSISLASIPSCSEYRGLQETSLNQSAGGCEDDDYQDVDVRRNDRVTNGAVSRSGGARLFDDRCYNSLDFGKRSDKVYPRKCNASPCNTHVHEDRFVDTSELERAMVNEYAELSDSNEHAHNISGCTEYNRIHYAPLDDKAQSYNHALQGSGSNPKRIIYSDRGNTTSSTSMGFLPAEPSGDVFYYQLEREERNKVDTSNEPQFPEAFYSEEYSVLNLQDDANDVSFSIRRESDFLDCHDTTNLEPQTCEVLYAKVDKAVEASSTPPPLCELYATVNKTRGACIGDSKPAWQEDLYINVNDT
ncbi:uncharacterized protein [Diadema setosum]|uniref:uncharacterized protein n=1 Tax=Diadema setosum TaxID=31175 RepID=UPI003B3A6218